MKNKTHKLITAKSLLGDNRGVTLIEMLIAMVVMALVGASAFTIYATSNWASRSQEEVAETQQNVRVAIDRMTRDIRMAGFGLPRDLVVLDFDNNTGTTEDQFSYPVTIEDSAAGPDKITAIVALRVGYLLDDGAGDSNTYGDTRICLESVEQANRFFSQDLSAFKVNRRYISIDGIVFNELSTSQTERANKKLILSEPLGRDYPDGAGVFILQAIQYEIVSDGSITGCTSDTPCLTTKDFTELRESNRRVLADVIEDLQVAVGIDADDDGKIDDVNAGTSPGYDTGDFIADGSASPADMVALRINLVGRSRHPDTTRSWAKDASRPAFENRPAGDSDGYRRRSLTKVIKIRNPSQT